MNKKNFAPLRLCVKKKDYKTTTLFFLFYNCTIYSLFKLFSPTLSLCTPKNSPSFPFLFLLIILHAPHTKCRPLIFARTIVNSCLIVCHSSKLSYGACPITSSGVFTRKRIVIVCMPSRIA